MCTYVYEMACEISIITRDPVANKSEEIHDSVENLSKKKVMIPYPIRPPPYLEFAVGL